MAWPKLATFNGSNLPPQFSYPLYVPPKRNTIHETHGSAVTQYAPNQIVHGAHFLTWTIDGGFPSEYNTLYGLWNTAAPTAYTFVGYWGEEYEVYFTLLNPPKVRGRLFNITGSFQVISVTTEPTPVCYEAV